MVFDKFLTIFSMLTYLCLLMFHLCRKELSKCFFIRYLINYQIKINTESGQFILLYQSRIETLFFFCKLFS